MKVGPDLLLASPLGTELSEEEAGILGSLMTMNTLADGDYLITEGTADDSLHLVLEGKLEIVKRTGAGEYSTLAVLREGDLAGELGFIDGETHSVSLRALCDSRVLSLRRQDFEGIIDGNPRLVYKIMRVIARSAHKVMRRMNTDFIELSNYIFKQHGRY